VAIFFSSLGAALKINPTKIQVAAFWKVHGCPLAASLRQKFKKGMMPSKKFLCVSSDEVLENQENRNGLTNAPQNRMDNLKSRINGSIVHITAIFGFTLAGLVVQDVCKTK
jgi:tRNA A37 threonylcarbamoyladenosine dehydratase